MSKWLRRTLRHCFIAANCGIGRHAPTGRRNPVPTRTHECPYVDMKFGLILVYNNLSSEAEIGATRRRNLGLCVNFFQKDRKEYS
jgi:hypothetical protein